MKRWLPVFVWAGLLIANVAFASGVDLTTYACPENPGAGVDRTSIDCAGGQSFELVITFEIEQSRPDLTGAEWYLDITTSGDIATTANFWDFASANPEGVSIGNSIPAARCDGFKRDLWTVPGSGSGWIATVTGPSTLRVVGIIYRPNGAAVVKDARNFVARMLVSLAPSVEGGGAFTGCCESATDFVLSALYPRTISGDYSTVFTSPGIVANWVHVAPASNCTGSVATKRSTWGALKSLYR